MKIANKIIEYRASLFDLLHENKSLSNKIQTWLTIVRNTLDIENAFFYINKNACFNLIEMDSYSDLPRKITLEEVKILFHDCVWKRFPSSSNKIHPFFDYGLLFETEGNSPLGILWLKCEEKQSISNEVLRDFWNSSNRFLQHCLYMEKIVKDEHRYRELFNVTEMFHSTREVPKLLRHMFATLERVYPKNDFQLLLSNDHDEYGDLPVGNFDFDQADSKAMKAFISGKMEVENGSLLYAPLRGKQGVYGILKVNSHSDFIFSNQQLEFIRLLAYTAGSALENAKLYEQSHRLITDLQLINETSHLLNMNSKMSETLALLKKQINRSFHSPTVGFAFWEKDEYKIFNVSSSFFFTKEGEKYITFVKNRIQKENDSIFIGELMETFADGSYRSLMAVPMLQGNILKGFCIVLHKLAYSFTFDMYKLLQSFIQHSTLAITNAMLREKLEKLVITDQMTNLYARHYLDESMEESLAKDQYGTFLLIDIDDFKAINDSYGHQVVDEVIIQVSNHLKNAIGDNGLVARWGGEELAVYLSNTSIEEGQRLAEKLVQTAPDNSNPKITLSCGVAQWTEKTDTIKELVRRADQALYFAKNNGKDQVIVGE